MVGTDRASDADLWETPSRAEALAPPPSARCVKPFGETQRASGGSSADGQKAHEKASADREMEEALKNPLEEPSIFTPEQKK